MSLNLLTRKVIAGQVEHLYYHDAESFIWVLTGICLRYDNGELLCRIRPLDRWLTVNAMGCHMKKTSYLASVDEIRPTQSHKGNFQVALQCLAVIHAHIGPLASASTNVDVVFDTWLKNHMPKNMLERNILSG